MKNTIRYIWYEQGWSSGESNRLPQMWPGFKSWCLRYTWLFCSERFFAAYSSFPLSLKTIISKFLFDQEPGRRRTTKWMCFLYKSLLLFIPRITGKMTMYQELISPLQIKWFSVRLVNLTAILGPMYSSLVLQLVLCFKLTVFKVLTSLNLLFAIK